MPRNAAGTFRAAAPHRSSTFCPTAADPDGDALLKARAATANPERFTAEHRAAYAAFAGITDEKTARMLHRSSVSWDDVDHYTRLGVGSDAFTQMCDLSRAGISPVVYEVWADLIRSHQVRKEHIIFYRQRNIRAAQVAAYLTGTADTDPSDAYLWGIPSLIDAHVAPDTAAAYRRAGVGTPNKIRDLHTIGCTATTVTAWYLRHPVRHAPSMPVTSQQTLLNAFTKAVTACPDPALVNAVFAADTATTTRVLDWDRLLTKHDVTTGRGEQVAALLAAGISCAEARRNPHLLTADRDTLAMLAALQHQPPLAMSLVAA